MARLEQILHNSIESQHHIIITHISLSCQFPNHGKMTKKVNSCLCSFNTPPFSLFLLTHYDNKRNLFLNRFVGYMYVVMSE